MPRSTAPVVIYRLGSLGDTVVALPCFHAIARAHPDAKRIVLTNFPVSSKAAPLEGIIGGSGLIDHALAYPVGTRSLRALWSLRQQLRDLDADTLYYLTPARGLGAAWRDWLYFKLCGFKRIVGAPLTKDLQANRIVNAQGHLERECVRLVRCLHDLGPIPVDDPGYWSLNLSEAERAAAATITAPLHDTPYLAINMGGKVAINDWGEDHWQALLGRLTQAYPHLGLLVVGGAEDQDRGRAAVGLWQGPAVNACGKLRPRESAAALAKAQLFIGHDSGPLHLAAAMGSPCIGLFGDNNPPAKWHPLGTAHTHLHDMRGVRYITVDQVMSGAGRFLSGSTLP